MTSGDKPTKPRPPEPPSTAPSPIASAAGSSGRGKRGAMDDFGKRLVENLNRNVRNNVPTS